MTREEAMQAWKQAIGPLRDASTALDAEIAKTKTLGRHSEGQAEALKTYRAARERYEDALDQVNKAYGPPNTDS